jgi:hypothetical protein
MAATAIARVFGDAYWRIESIMAAEYGSKVLLLKVYVAKGG